MRTSPAPTRAVLLLAALAACLAPSVGRAEDKPKPPALSPELRQLVQDLGDARFPIRERASDRLRALGLDALPALEEAAESNDPEMRQRAWHLIDAWAAEGKVPALLYQLSSRHEPTRAAAADCLGKMGSAARPAVAALTKATQDGSDVVRCCAREALKNIQSAPEITVEVQALDDNPKVGDTKRYQIEVSNTGSAAATQVRIIGLVPAEVKVDGVVGPEARMDGQRLVSVPVTLEPNSKVRWEIATKVGRKGNTPLAVEVFAAELVQPLRGGDNMPAQIGVARPTPQDISPPPVSMPVPVPQMAPPPPPPVQMPVDPIPAPQLPVVVPPSSRP